jgi:hypothetical protein
VVVVVVEVDVEDVVVDEVELVDVVDAFNVVDVGSWVDVVVGSGVTSPCCMQPAETMTKKVSTINLVSITEHNATAIKGLCGFHKGSCSFYMLPQILPNVELKIIIPLLLLAAFSGCLGPEPIELSGVEVREYKGEKLSSVNDFRENSIKGPQQVDVNAYTLTLTGLVEKPAELSYADVINSQTYTKVVTLHCVEGWSAKILWEGVLVKDLLDEAGVKAGANTVIFHAYDGYTTSLPLSYILDNDILLAYKMNDVTLPPERGFPFQLVAEDKWGYKWAKWVTKIELSDDPQFRGYWEARGYNQDGSLSGPKRE